MAPNGGTYAQDIYCGQMKQAEKKHNTDALFIEFVTDVAGGKLSKRVTFEEWKRQRRADLEWKHLLEKTRNGLFAEHDLQELLEHLSGER